MLMIGITIGVGGSFFAIQTAIYTATVPKPTVPTVPASPNLTPQVITPVVSKSPQY